MRDNSAGRSLNRTLVMLISVKDGSYSFYNITACDKVKYEDHILLILIYMCNDDRACKFSNVKWIVK